MEPQVQRSWWERNWKWVVPAGCGTVVVLAAIVAGGMVGLLFGAMKKSDAYARGLERARADCEVQRELGAPVEAGFFTGGSIQVTGPSGHAELSIPLSGAAAKGTLYVHATKEAGRWTFELLEVEVAGRAERIDLLPEDRPVCD
ncbi:MAG: hypothetical protein H6Q03_352 [Acidobacteria bacterium]|jgi:hypothetical protein|nr:hypothetical protein [Acidobacteriota bacterium]